MFKSNPGRVAAAAPGSDAKVIQERTLSRLSRFPSRDPVQSARDYQAESLKRLARLAGRNVRNDPRT